MTTYLTRDQAEAQLVRASGERLIPLLYDGERAAVFFVTEGYGWLSDGRMAVGLPGLEVEPTASGAGLRLPGPGPLPAPTFRVSRAFLVEVLPVNSAGAECKACEGSGLLECGACDGDRSHVCTRCDTRHDCGECDGAGEVACDCQIHPMRRSSHGAPAFWLQLPSGVRLPFQARFFWHALQVVPPDVDVALNRTLVQVEPTGERILVMSLVRETADEAAPVVVLQ